MARARWRVSCVAIQRLTEGHSSGLSSRSGAGAEQLAPVIELPSTTSSHPGIGRMRWILTKQIFRVDWS